MGISSFYCCCLEQDQFLEYAKQYSFESGGSFFRFEHTGYHYMQLSGDFLQSTNNKIYSELGSFAKDWSSYSKGLR